MEIVGVPEKVGENTNKIVIEVAELLYVEITDERCCGEITSAVGLEISRFSVVQFFLDRSLPWQPLSELACCIRSVNYECRL